MTAQEMILSYSPVKICGLRNLSDFLFVSFCLCFICFVLLLEGSGGEANEHDVKKMELPGC